MTALHQETLIGQVMTKAPKSIGTEQTVKTAKEMMMESGIRHLAVQEKGDLIGVVSDRDIYFALGVERKKDTELVVDDVYTPDPIIVGPKTKLENVVKRLYEERIGCVFIEEKGELVGVYTTTDACRDLYSLLSGVESSEKSAG